jgi:hypothetical protein
MRWRAGKQAIRRPQAVSHYVPLLPAIEHATNVCQMWQCCRPPSGTLFLARICVPGAVLSVDHSINDVVTNDIIVGALSTVGT